MVSQHWPKSASATSKRALSARTSGRERRDRRWPRPSQRRHTAQAHAAPTNFCGSTYSQSPQGDRQAVPVSWFVHGFIGVGLSFIFRWQLAWPGTARTRMARSPRLSTTNSSRCMAPSWCSSSRCHPAGRVWQFRGAADGWSARHGLPRLNMSSFWTVFVASVILLISFFVPNGASRAGWTNYVPLSDAPRYTAELLGGNLWLIAVATDFASS